MEDGIVFIHSFIQQVFIKYSLNIKYININVQNKIPDLLDLTLY